MSYLVTETETVTIGAVPLNTPAWALTNLYDLWSGPPTRGTDIVIPEADGQRPYPRKIDAWRVTLNLAIYGDVKWDGTANTDERLGLWANIAHLRANAFDPPGGAGTRTIAMTLPDATELTGTVIVERFSVGAPAGWGAVLATADVVIMEGQLT